VRWTLWGGAGSRTSQHPAKFQRNTFYCRVREKRRFLSPLTPPHPIHVSADNSKPLTLRIHASGSIRGWGGRWDNENTSRPNHRLHINGQSSLLATKTLFCRPRNMRTFISARQNYTDSRCDSTKISRPTHTTRRTWNFMANPKLLRPIRNLTAESKLTRLFISNSPPTWTRDVTCIK